jgi:hypothetical protein
MIRVRLLNQSAQSRFEPRGFIFVNEFLGSGLIQLPGGGLERRLGGARIARRGGFVYFADHGSQGSPGGPVSQPALVGLTHRLGGISIIGHGSTQNGVKENRKLQNPTV